VSSLVSQPPPVWPGEEGTRFSIGLLPEAGGSALDVSRDILTRLRRHLVEQVMQTNL